MKEFNFYYALLMFIVNLFGLLLWKIKKGITITYVFQIIWPSYENDRRVAESKGRKPNKIWLDKSSELYKKSFKLWVPDNEIEIFNP